MVPLDWGLGHATRCIPLIRELQSQGADIWLAGEGPSAALLKEAFPDLLMLNLQGYHVQYAKTKTGLLVKMLMQIPGIISSIKHENRWLKKIVATHQIDAVISDNRYGLYHKKIPCIFITHQLRIKLPLGNRMEHWLQRINYRYIQRFSQCWVPDYETDPGLAGELSHPARKPGIPLTYIGPLSRFVQTPVQQTTDHLLLLLSGPEPQRTILEEKLIAELVHLHVSATLVRGLPGHTAILPSTNMIRIYNHLPADALGEELQKASMVICRSGYSTLMDLAALGKKSILVPTPGQTEQEYLAVLHRAQKTAFPATQQTFSLTNVLKLSADFDYSAFPQSVKNELSPAVSRLLALLH